MQSTMVDSLIVPYNRAKGEVVSTLNSGVVFADISIVVTGDEAVCQAMLDDLCSNSSIRIRGFEWMEMDLISQYDEESGTTEYIIPDSRRLRVDLRIYMLNVADYEAMVNAAVAEAGAEG